jgi:hypothetical protein
MRATNGESTQIHALVPGRPAIHAGGPVCLDANGDPLPTEQRGKPRFVNGNGDGTAACAIGAFDFSPRVNDFATLDPPLDTALIPYPCLASEPGSQVRARDEITLTD